MPHRRVSRRRHRRPRQDQASEQPRLLTQLLTASRRCNATAPRTTFVPRLPGCGLVISGSVWNTSRQQFARPLPPFLGDPAEEEHGAYLGQQVKQSYQPRPGLTVVDRDGFRRSVIGHGTTFQWKVRHRRGEVPAAVADRSARSGLVLHLRRVRPHDQGRHLASGGCSGNPIRLRQHHPNHRDRPQRAQGRRPARTRPLANVDGQQQRPVGDRRPAGTQLPLLQPHLGPLHPTRPTNQERSPYAYAQSDPINNSDPTRRSVRMTNYCQSCSAPSGHSSALRPFSSPCEADERSNGKQRGARRPSGRATRCPADAASQVRRRPRATWCLHTARSSCAGRQPICAAAA
ncbi:hypothetical protein Actkin_00620 [Actinokineospora sp. UTMC 2448]|nr:hypothetical protein Actkin_00620 [Actinokineospora sp. UTMC 2448]